MDHLAAKLSRIIRKIPRSEITVLNFNDLLKRNNNLKTKTKHIHFLYKTFKTFQV